MRARVRSVAVMTMVAVACCVLPVAAPTLVAQRAEATKDAQPATPAAAPELSGLGAIHMPVSTRHPRAQAFFDRRAQALASQGSLKERALIDALATRFASDGAAPRAPLDRAYADAMTKVAGAFPDDADVQTLYADAVMNTMAWDYWQKDGTLKREAEPIRRALERVVAAHQDHAGAHHYYTTSWRAPVLRRSSRRARIAWVG